MTVQKEDSNLLRVGLAQIAPVWLDRARTLLKVETYVEQAAGQGCHLVVFGEALVPGYPFWPELTDGARFNSALQKSIFAEYSEQAVQTGGGASRWIVRSGRAAPHRNLPGNRRTPGRPRIAEPILLPDLHRSGRADHAAPSKADAHVRRAA